MKLHINESSRHAPDVDFYSLNNADELKEELIEILKQFDKDLNQYDTDVYLYVDQDTNTGSWYLFTNVGGNSWLDDDHITVYTDKQHYNDIFDYFDSIHYIADVLGMSEEQLRREVYEANPYGTYDTYDSIDDVDYGECIDYIKNYRDDYLDMLQEEYNSVIDSDYNSEYEEKAHEIISDINRNDW